MRYSALIIIILHFFGKKLENVYNFMYICGKK